MFDTGKTVRVAGSAALMSFLLAVTGVQASPEIVMADDGRLIRLNDDGTWAVVSEDRHATTGDGRRIVLGADGRWREADEQSRWVTLPTEAVVTSRDTIVDEALEVELVSLEIEEARGSKHKNTTLKAQTIARLQFSSSAQVDSLVLSPSQFTIRDSKGRDYPVEQVVPALVTLEPGRPVMLTLVADGSPRWWGVKFFRVEVRNGALGNRESLELTKAMAEVQEKQVESLTSFN